MQSTDSWVGWRWEVGSVRPSALLTPSIETHCLREATSSKENLLMAVFIIWVFDLCFTEVEWRIVKNPARTTLLTRWPHAHLRKALWIGRLEWDQQASPSLHLYSLTGHPKIQITAMVHRSLVLSKEHKIYVYFRTESLVLSQEQPVLVSETLLVSLLRTDVNCGINHRCLTKVTIAGHGQMWQSSWTTLRRLVCFLLRIVSRFICLVIGSCLRICPPFVQPYVIRFWCVFSIVVGDKDIRHGPHGDLQARAPLKPHLKSSSYRVLSSVLACSCLCTQNIPSTFSSMFAVVAQGCPSMAWTLEKKAQEGGGSGGCGGLSEFSFLGWGHWKQFRSVVMKVSNLWCPCLILLRAEIMGLCYYIQLSIRFFSISFQPGVMSAKRLVLGQRHSSCKAACGFAHLLAGPGAMGQLWSCRRKGLSHVCSGHGTCLHTVAVLVNGLCLFSVREH